MSEKAKINIRKRPIGIPGLDAVLGSGLPELSFNIIVKMRGGDHSKAICEYEITSEVLAVGTHLKKYRGLITGVPERLRAVRDEETK